MDQFVLSEHVTNSSYQYVEEQQQFVPSAQGVLKQLYMVISEWSLDEKLAYSAIKKAGLPRSYEEDAFQEVIIEWMQLEVDITRDKGSICSYANQVAYTTALRIKRDLAGPVRLPGNAFKHRSDGNTYVEAGHLAAPLNFEDDLSEVVASELLSDTYSKDHNAISEAEMIRRLDFIDNSEECTVLTRKQKAICKNIVMGKNIYDLELELGIMNVTILRTLRNIRSVFNDTNI